MKIAVFFLPTILLAALFAACSGKAYELVDPAKFNASISERTDIESIDDLLLLYYDYPEVEGPANIKTSFKLEGDIYVGTLIHDGMQDDSQKALKIVVSAKKNGETWKVLEIRKSRKCYPSRGHENWGAEWCS